MPFKEKLLRGGVLSLPSGNPPRLLGNHKVKTMLKLALIGIVSALLAVQTKAATNTNYWVQNVNIALTAYVQEGGNAVRGTLNTKQFIAFLSGMTNTAIISSEIDDVPITNSVFTNLTITATNFWLLPVTAAPPDDLPRSYTITSNYVVTPDAGLTFYTNNVNFTNDLLINRTTATNVTYTFNNQVSISSTQTAYLFPDIPANTITAAWTNEGPGSVFVLRGGFYTNVVGTSTNFVYGTNPLFTNYPGCKLLFVTPVVGGANRPSYYVVRYTLGRTNVDTDISNFIYESPSSPYISVTQVGSVSFITAFSEIDFNNGTGTTFNLVGFDSQMRAPLFSKTNVLSASVIKSRKIIAGNYGGQINYKIQDHSFNNASVVVTGTITIGGGKVE